MPIENSGEIQMFWKKQSKEDEFFKAANEQAQVIKAIAQVQASNPKYLIRIQQEENRVISKIVNYIYYDFIAQIYSYKICNQKNDILRAYIRNEALAEIEPMVGKQFRSYATNPKSYSDIANQALHPNEILIELENNQIFEFMLRKKVEIKVEELIDTILTSNAPVREDISKASQHLFELISDDELAKVIATTLEMPAIRCGTCFATEEVEDINIRENTKLYLYKTNERRTADDLEIFSCICYDCGAITEFSFDPYNFSNNATDGVEYFRSYLVDRNSLKQIFEQMRSMGHMDPILRLIAKHPDKLE